MVLDTVSTVSEIELMQRISESDSNAVEVLYDKYASLLYTFIKKILKDDIAAEETVEDIFLTINRKINYFDFDTKNSYTWIITLAKNKAVYELRRAKNPDSNKETTYVSKNNFILPRISHLSEPLDLERALDNKDKIERALNGLTGAQQYVIYLAFYEGLTQDEIADRLRIPLQTVESKIKISLINLNENFDGSTHSFSVRNQIVDMIHPYALGCLKENEMISAYNTFKSSEIFPWKLLGKYQNLVSLLPVMLNFEEPPIELKDRILNKLYRMKEENEIESFQTIIEQEEVIEHGKFDRIESLSNELIESENLKKGNGASESEPVIPFRIVDEEEPEGLPHETLSKYHFPERIYLNQERNYTGILAFVFAFILIVAIVFTYLFYKDRSGYYESQIENLNQRIQSLVDENLNRPEIPGLTKLVNPQTVELEATGESLTSKGKITVSFEDKRGYLHSLNLPVLSPESAYQLWGNFGGKLVSLGVFKVSTSPDYYPFTLPQSVASGPTEFYLVESTSAGSKNLGYKIYLKGKM